MLPRGKLCTWWSSTSVAAALQFFRFRNGAPDRYHDPAA